MSILRTFLLNQLQPATACAQHSQQGKAISVRSPAIHCPINPMLIFRCPHCDRCFGQQTNLDRHLKKHENELSEQQSKDGQSEGALPERMPADSTTPGPAGNGAINNSRRSSLDRCSSSSISAAGSPSHHGSLFSSISNFFCTGKKNERGEGKLN